MKTLGMVLAIVGVVALVYGGIGYNRRTTILEVGDLKATAMEHKTIPIAPLAGGIALAGGIVLMLVPRRRLA
jgi:hypothetical protein